MALTQAGGPAGGAKPSIIGILKILTALMWLNVGNVFAFKANGGNCCVLFSEPCREQGWRCETHRVPGLPHRHLAGQDVEILPGLPVIPKLHADKSKSNIGEGAKLILHRK